MTKSHRTGVEAVFAVVRLDLPLRGEEPEDLIQHFKIVEALPTQAEADAEVARLTALNAGKGSTYFSHYVRYHPDGRATRT